MFLVPESILQKPARLTPEEWYEVQKHPIIGLHILESCPWLTDAALFAAYQAHERDNGTGYPKQRNKHLIHDFAKIVQVADVYEAMTSPRCYREAWLPHVATSSLVKMTRAGLLDGAFVKGFLQYASLFPVGSLVELSDKRIARVVQSNGSSYAKPVVSILIDASGKPVESSEICQFDLVLNPDVQILRAFGTGQTQNLRLTEGF
jgi:HD-GYP domain-containing protein (c-di-GMP phosphodiesterase class II)